MIKKNHQCVLVQEESPLDKLPWCHKIRLISSDNPQTMTHFRSSVALKEEKLRHLKTSKISIHPFSSFRAWYEVYLIYLYLSVLITKPVDAGLMRISKKATQINLYRHYTVFTDCLSWIDIALNFFTGYELQTEKALELRMKHIVKHYAIGPVFFFDIITSIPKSVSVKFPKTAPWARPTVGVISLMNLCKIFKLVSLLKCINRTSDFFNVKSKGSIFVLCSLLVFFMIVHWMACLQFAVPKFFRLFFPKEVQKVSWYFVDKRFSLLDKNVMLQYIHGVFMSSAYILGVRIVGIYNLKQPEEIVLAIITYFIGKILIAFVWIILAVAILNARIMDIKFAEAINQLGEYMRQRQLPLSLRKRIMGYFRYKYQNKYYKEGLVTSLLSDNLRRETNMHACKSLLKNVPLFRQLTSRELIVFVDRLIAEIYLPNDTIMHVGGPADAMYFLSSGTVAVYTRSGKEAYHLQDGAYFGEVALLVKGQVRSVNVVALETCHIYRLNKVDFNKFLITNKAVKDVLLKYAEYRLRRVAKMEEEYKLHVMDQTNHTFDTASDKQ